jgi:hypothetical protein
VRAGVRCAVDREPGDGGIDASEANGGDSGTRDSGARDVSAEGDTIPAQCVEFATTYCGCVHNATAPCISQIESECSDTLGWEPLTDCEVAAQTCDQLFACEPDGGQPRSDGPRRRSLLARRDSPDFFVAEDRSRRAGPDLLVGRDRLGVTGNDLVTQSQ